jgi:hypothetical protein
MIDFEQVYLISYLILLGIIYSKIIKSEIDTCNIKNSNWITVIGLTLILYLFVHVAYFSSLGNSMNILQTVIVTLIVSGAGFMFAYNTHPSDKFKSRTERSSPRSPGTTIIFKEVSESDNQLIPTYPRISVFALDSDKSKRKMIFDSSDIVVLNKVFNLENVHHKSLQFGNKFLLNKDEFTIRKVEVVIANFFDDYSKYGTSSVYQGKEIPYNIRVVVHASSTNKSR